MNGTYAGPARKERPRRKVLALVGAALLVAATLLFAEPASAAQLSPGGENVSVFVVTSADQPNPLGPPGSTIDRASLNRLSSGLTVSTLEQRSAREDASHHDETRTEAPAAGVALARDPVTMNECRATQPAVSRWVHKNRYSACRLVSYIYFHYRCTTPTSCIEIGREGFYIDIISVGNAGGSGGPRVFSTTFATRKPFASGENLNPHQQVALSTSCAPVGGSTCSQPAGRTLTIAQWGQGAEVAQQYSAGGTGATGDPDVKTYYDVRLRALTGDQAPIFTDAAPLRCDLASYAEGGGCVYTNVTSYLQYSKSDPAVNEAAQHIEDAQFSRANVLPPAANLVIPGGHNTGIPLTRLYHDMTRRNANNADAKAACVKYFGANYTDGGKDCDEYPFRTTYEGAAYGRPAYAGPNTARSFSARPITSGDNRLAGSRLGTWMTQDHVLDGDTFFVEIIP
jgi:hypothetical protein